MKKASVFLPAAAVVICLAFASCGGTNTATDSTTTASGTTAAPTVAQHYTEIQTQTQIVTDKSGHTSMSVVGSAVVDHTRIVTAKATTKKAATTAKKTTAKPAEKVTATTAAAQKTSISLTGSSATFSGKGVSVTGSKITISTAGVYTIKGKLTNGQIIVNAPKTDKVQLVLSGANITCTSGSAIHADSSATTVITTEKGTVNTITDSSKYTTEDTNACIYSDDDLTLNGEGTLNVIAKFKNGVSSKNDVKMTAGTVNITAVNNGIRGKDRVEIKGGTLFVDAGNDAIKATNETEAGKGTIAVTGGSITIKAGDDAFQAITSITIAGCKLKMDEQGKKYNCVGAVKVDPACIVA